MCWSSGWESLSFKAENASIPRWSSSAFSPLGKEICLKLHLAAVSLVTGQNFAFRRML